MSIGLTAKGEVNVFGRVAWETVDGVIYVVIGDGSPKAEYDENDRMTAMLACALLTYMAG